MASDNFNGGQELNKLQEEMAKMRAEFQAEVETLKNNHQKENKLLLVNNKVLVAKVAELQEHNDGLQAKLELAELKSKSEQQVKSNEQTGQLAEKQDKTEKRISDLESLTNKMVEEQINMQKQLREQETKRAEEDSKLEEKMENQFLVTIHGEYSEDKVLTAMQMCMERPRALRNVLEKMHDLYKYGNNLHRRVEAFHLMLRALERHLDNEKVQAAGFSSMQRITDEMDQDTKRLVAQQLIEGIENHQDSSAMVRIYCVCLCQLDIPQDVMFAYGRLAKLLTKILETHEVDETAHQLEVISLLKAMVDQEESKLKVEMGETGVIEIMVQQISRIFQANDEGNVSGSSLRKIAHLCHFHQYKLGKIGWSFLVSVTEGTPANCERFLKAQGLELFSRCYGEIKDNTKLIRNMMMVMWNISQVSQLRAQLMTDENMATLCKFLVNLNEAEDIRLAYISAGVFANLVSAGDKCWTKSGFTSLTRDHVSKLIGQEIVKWDSQAPLHTFINYSSLKPILRLLPLWHASASQHWAVWTLANLTTTDEKQTYCRFITEEGGGMRLLKKLSTDSRSTGRVRQLARIVIKSVEDWKKDSRDE